MGEVLLETSPRFTFTPRTPTTSSRFEFELFESRLLSTPRNPSTPHLFLGSQISVGEGDSASSKRITQMATLSDLLVSDKLKASPNRTETTQTTPHTASSGDQRLDIDSPPSTLSYQNRYADDFLAGTRPTSPMSIYTPTQTTTIPPPNQ